MYGGWERHQDEINRAKLPSYFQAVSLTTRGILKRESRLSQYFGVHILRDSRIFGGRPIIDGHRISVHDIVVWYREGESAEEIAEDFELTPLEVRAAIAYYQEHQEEIDRELAEDEREIAMRADRDKSPATERLREVPRKRPPGGQISPTL